MELENSKGTRDFAPEEKIIRNEIVEKLRQVFESYGYSPLETPVIERMDVLTAKAGAGQGSDAFNEIFKLTDQGERKLGLRFDLTVPFARFIGMNPSLRMPFKRYQIEPVFRDGPIKLGRYRQFWQCDADVVGCKGMIADAEMVCLALGVFKTLGIDAYLEVNNRKILKGIIQMAGINEKLSDQVIISIDKLGKIGRLGVKKELEEKGIGTDKIKTLLDAFDIKGEYQEKLAYLKDMIDNEIGKEGLMEIEALFSYFSDKDLQSVVFNVSLARGLGYYTGTIFEGFAKDSKVTSSICGGGRYDKLIGMLLGSSKEYPAIGISFGLDVITDVLKLQGVNAKTTVIKAYVIPIKTLKQSFEICQELRKSGINTDIDFMERGISKNLDYLNTSKIPYAIIIGNQEIMAGKIKLRDMAVGKEELLTIKDAIVKLKN